MYPYGDLRILLEENENRLFLSIQKRNCPSPKIEEGRKKKEVKMENGKLQQSKNVDIQRFYFKNYCMHFSDKGNPPTL